MDEIDLELPVVCQEFPNGAKRFHGLILVAEIGRNRVVWAFLHSQGLFLANHANAKGPALALVPLKGERELEDLRLPLPLFPRRIVRQLRDASSHSSGPSVRNAELW